jgi:hypothetical protein
VCPPRRARDRKPCRGAQDFWGEALKSRIVIPGCAEGAGPESITTIGSMDSGLALRAPRNDGYRGSQQDARDSIICPATQFG